MGASLTTSGLLHYLIHTRGIRGLGPFVGFALIYAAPLLAAYVALQRSAH